MNTHYTTTAKALHWGIALLIFGMLGLGVYMTDLALSPAKLQVYAWHKWTGVTVFALVALRLLWRLIHRPPALPPSVVRGMPAWQLRAYEATHVAMYALFFVVPLLGWAYSSAAGFPIVAFGVLPLPDFVPTDKALAELIKPLHGFAAFTLAALVVVHVGAALKHHWIDKDGLLNRMLPGRN